MMRKRDVLGGFFALYFIASFFGGDDEPEKQEAEPEKPKTVALAPAPEQKKQGIHIPLRQVVKEAPKPAPEKPKPVFKAVTMYVDASRLNVRNQAGKQGRVVWTLKRDEAVQVVAKEGDWLAVKSPRYEGWVFGTYLTPNPASKKKKAPVSQKSQISVAAVKRILIERSHAYYRGSCPCPYNTTRAGRRCGKRSAYSRPGGASPLCYASDISTSMVREYLARQ